MNDRDPFVNWLVNHPIITRAGAWLVGIAFWSLLIPLAVCEALFAKKNPKSSGRK